MATTDKINIKVWPSSTGYTVLFDGIATIQIAGASQGMDFHHGLKCHFSAQNADCIASDVAMLLRALGHHVGLVLANGDGEVL